MIRRHLHVLEMQEAPLSVARHPNASVVFDVGVFQNHRACAANHATPAVVPGHAGQIENAYAMVLHSDAVSGAAGNFDPVSPESGVVSDVDPAVGVAEDTGVKLDCAPLLASYGSLPTSN